MTTSHRAYVISAETNGDNVNVVWVRCPYCYGFQQYSRNHHDEIGRRYPSAERSPASWSSSDPSHYT